MCLPSTLEVHILTTHRRLGLFSPIKKQHLTSKYHILVILLLLLKILSYTKNATLHFISYNRTMSPFPVILPLSDPWLCRNVCDVPFPLHPIRTLQHAQNAVSLVKGSSTNATEKPGCVALTGYPLVGLIQHNVVERESRYFEAIRRILKHSILRTVC